MTWDDFVRHCAIYGFTYNPLTRAEFDSLPEYCDAYQVACDVHAGFTLRQAIDAQSTGNANANS